MRDDGIVPWIEVNWFVQLFIILETGSGIFAGCQLLTSRRVTDWVATYHSVLGAKLIIIRFPSRFPVEYELVAI